MVWYSTAGEGLEPFLAIAGWVLAHLSIWSEVLLANLPREHVDFLSLFLALLTTSMMKQHNTDVLKFRDSFLIMFK